MKKVKLAEFRFFLYIVAKPLNYIRARDSNKIKEKGMRVHDGGIFITLVRTAKESQVPCVNVGE